MIQRRTLIRVVFCLGLSVMAMPSQTRAAHDGASRFLVKFRSGTVNPQVRLLHDVHRVMPQRQNAHVERLVQRNPHFALQESVDPLASIFVLSFFGTSDDVIVTLKASDQAIEYVEADKPVKAFFTPNDPAFATQWHLSKDNLESAWDFDTQDPLYGGDPSVTIAVLDTGTAYENATVGGTTYAIAPDLAQAHFLPGYDFINNDAHPNDDNGHGTHVTATIVEDTNNGNAGAGVAFNTSIMPIKVLDANGIGTTTDVARGIDFATQNNANIVNLSLGSPTTSTTLQTAVANAFNAGVIIVAAAGNDGVAALSYPAAYDGVLAVSAVGKDDSLASYSNYGTGIRVAAPGGDSNDYIWQQTFSNVDGNNLPLDYTTFGMVGYQGTSQAAPQVSGAVALLLARGVKAGAVAGLLEGTAVDLGDPGYDTKFGYGRIDIAAALNAYINDTTAPTATVAVTPTEPNGGSGYYNSAPTITLSADDGSGGSGVRTISFFWDDDPASAYTNPLLATEGSHTLTYYATDLVGNQSASQSIIVKLDSTGPTITAGAPYGRTTKTHIVVTGTVIDAASGISSLQLNGEQLVIDARGHFQTTAILATGMNTLNFIGSDIAGNQTTTVRQLRVVSPAQIYTGLDSATPQTTLYSATGRKKVSFFPFPKNFTGGVHLASGDFDYDGNDEIVVSPGAGGGPQVKIFDAHAKLLSQFFAYDKKFRGGVQIAVADTTADGKAEIITSPGAGGGPQVKIFDAHAKLLSQFFAYDKKFRGGVQIAACDLDNDGASEIMTAPMGERALPVRIFTAQGKRLHEFYPFGKKYALGDALACGDLNGQGIGDIIVAPSGQYAPQVKIFNAKGKLLSKFFAYDKSSVFGVHVAVGDTNGDGTAEIIAVPGQGGGPQVRVFDKKGHLRHQFFATDKSYRGGINLAASFRAL